MLPKRSWPNSGSGPNNPAKIKPGFNIGKDVEVRYIVSDDIAGSEWMTPRTIKGATTLSSGKSGELTKNIGLNEIMKKKHKTRTGKPFDPKTIAKIEK